MRCPNNGLNRRARIKITPQLSKIHLLRLVKNNRVSVDDVWCVNRWCMVSDPQSPRRLEPSIQSCCLCFTLNQRVFWWSAAGPGHIASFRHTNPAQADVSGIAMFMGCAPVCDVWCSCVMMSIWRALCLEGFSLFKQANKLFFADQDIY